MSFRVKTDYYAAMVKKVGKFFKNMKKGGGSASSTSGAESSSFKSSKSGGDGTGRTLGVLKQGHAMRVIFFYPGEEGTYVDNAEVTLYENGIIHIQSNQEETTTHLQNCEILWRFETDAEERTNKVRLLKPTREGRGTEIAGKDSPNLDKDPDSSGPGSKGPTGGKSPDRH
jgi:hypothetical protein